VVQEGVEALQLGVDPGHVLLCQRPGLHHRVRLNAALASVISIVDSADARPTVQARALAEEYMARIDAELERLNALLDHDLRAFNDLVSEVGLPPVEMP